MLLLLVLIGILIYTLLFVVALIIWLLVCIDNFSTHLGLLMSFGLQIHNNLFPTWGKGCSFFKWAKVNILEMEASLTH